MAGTGMAAMRAAQRTAPLLRQRFFTQSTAAAGIRASNNAAIVSQHNSVEQLETMLPKHSARASSRLVSCISMGSVHHGAEGYFVRYVSPY